MTVRPTTRAQREAVWQLFCRDHDLSYDTHRAHLRSYRRFRRKVYWCGVANDMFLGVNLWGMFIGIERDGHTHS